MKDRSHGAYSLVLLLLCLEVIDLHETDDILRKIAMRYYSSGDYSA